MEKAILNCFNKYLIDIYIPSKTFLLGEYLALSGGPSLLINTPKNFILKINQPDDCNFLKQINNKKTHPAFLLLKDYIGQLNTCDTDKFKNFFKNCSFKDPYNASGGFGCSGAEFLSVYIIINLHKLFFNKKENILNTTNTTNADNKISIQEFKQKWDTFLNTEKKELNVFYTFKKLTNLGSGFDILSQLFGSLVFLEFLDKNLDSHSLNSHSLDSANISNFKYKNFYWPFKNYQFSILKSKNKVDTYKHLSSITKSKLDIVKKALTPTVKKAFIAIDEKNIDNFLSSVTEQQKILEKQGLVCLESTNTVKEFNKIPEILASKSCGALGADTFLIFYSSDSKDIIKEKIKTSKILSSLLFIKDNYLSDGLKLQIKDIK
ncbi:MAG: hypothetical protein HAW60_01525 [Bdellovibrionales bacterium]|nr:hypothetical protein [Bdellovibrionales bacterium]